MEFGWTEQQQALWNDICQFAGAELRLDDLADRDQHGAFLEENWQACAQKGLLGLCMPTEYGGAGYSMVTTIRALEALGYGCPDNGFTLALNGQTWSVQIPILKFGTAAQKAKYLPGLINGTLKGAHAVTEPESGSDVFSMETTAEKTDGGYLLNGRKIFIGMGPVADVLIVFATLNPKHGRWGITGFIVDANSPGVEQGHPRGKMGLRTEPMGDICFENVFVPAENRLGREGAGASLFSAAMSYERSFIFTSHVGSMARQLDQTIAYVKERKQGGQSISKYQSVSNRIADMQVRLETARAFLYKAAWLIDQGQDVSLQAAMTKLVVSELFVENSLDAVRLHGGRGYLSEVGIERDLRDAVGGVIYAGTSDIQRNMIAGLMGL
jgi:alkylation response protein AidB-like acyl-CoA dehydrogenase